MATTCGFDKSAGNELRAEKAEVMVNGNPKMGSPCVSSSRSAMVGKRSLSTYIHSFVI